MVTISTHNGASVSQAHNRRTEKVVSKEEHIFQEGAMRPNGREAHFEVWHDLDERDAYKRIFGKAQRMYNEKQTRSDRKIEDYYEKVKADKKLNTSYEMIIGVYGADTSPETCKAILNEFALGWKERNPNLVLIGVYYHDDELGKEPHVHLDYIPVAKGYTRGMKVQNGLNRALEQQGFESKSINQTAQIAWERRENQVLENICKAHGLEVDHPQRGKGVEHVHTELYKAEKELEHSKERLAEIDGRVKRAEELKHKVSDKTLFGKDKDTVTIDYEEYRSLQKTARAVEDVQQVKQELDAKANELNQMAASIQPQYDNSLELERKAREKEREAELHRAQALKYEVELERQIVERAKDMAKDIAENLHQEWSAKYHSNDSKLERFKNFLKENQRDPSVIDRLSTRFEEREVELERSWARARDDFDIER